jgi:pimeloyl-ACP methyl ester carboxylesterase
MRYELLEPDRAMVTRSTKLLFVHGLWHGAWCWEGRRLRSEEAEEGFRAYFLKLGYAAYALSLRGHGKSQGGERLRWTSIEDYADDIAWAIESIGGPTVIVAHSMGSHVAQKYLARPADPTDRSRPYPVVGVVLVAPVPPAGVLGLFLRLLFSRNVGRVVASVFTFSVWPVIRTAVLARRVLFSASMPLDEVERYHKRREGRAVLDMLLLNRPKPAKVIAAREALHVRVLGAQRDAIFTAEEVNATADAYNAPLLTFDTAHDIMLEERWEEAAKGMAEWLEYKGLAGTL